MGECLRRATGRGDPSDDGAVELLSAPGLRHCWGAPSRHMLMLLRRCGPTMRNRGSSSRESNSSSLSRGYEIEVNPFFLLFFFSFCSLMYAWCSRLIFFPIYPTLVINNSPAPPSSCDPSSKTAQMQFMHLPFYAPQYRPAFDSYIP